MKLHKSTSAHLVSFAARPRRRAVYPLRLVLTSLRSGGSVCPMSDSVTVTSRQSWFSRIGGAVAGVLFGIILFIGSFPLLIWNEGKAIARARTLDAGLKRVITVPATPLDTANDGKLIHLTGDTAAGGPATDPVFGISASAVKLRRNVEMYQWTEDKKSETKKSVGGSEETVTTYTYQKRWDSSLNKSSEFKKPDGHANPDQMPVKGSTFVAPGLTVGDFTLSASLIDMINDFHSLPVTKNTETQISADFSAPVTTLGEGFYFGENPKEPAIGDAKITFEVVDLGPISIVARQTGRTFEPYQIGGGLGSIELLRQGSVSAANMFASEQQMNAIFTWIIRFIGFIMMAIGVSLIAKPLAVIADFIPFFGSIANAGIGLLALIVALPLSLGTIALAWLAYRPLIGIPLFILAAASVFLGIRALLRKRAASLTPPKLPTA